MAGRVKVLDGRDVDERRSSILEKLGVSEEELRERGEHYALSADELAALDELDGLDYLSHGIQSRA